MPMRSLPVNPFFLFSLLVVVSQVGDISAEDDSTNIAAILNVNSRIGQEEKTSMEIAIEKLSNTSNKHKLVLHVRNSGGDPLKASAAADELIKKKQVQAIIGMDSWNEASLVIEVANITRTPILSFSSPSVTPSETLDRWPFLVRMASSDAIQMQCVAAIVGSFAWHSVIAIYEDDSYNTDMGILSLLSDALGAVGAEIEHSVAFPPFSTISDPKSFLEKELEKVLINKQSRIFILLRSSLELATHVLIQAQHIGLMEKDSVWITADPITSLLGTVNWQVITSMQGLIGIKPHISDKSPSVLRFSTTFKRKVQSMYSKEEMPTPGIHALRAYDAILAVASALETSTTKISINSSRIFLENLLSTNFNGLSGKVQFDNGELSQMTYEIVNWFGKSYTVINLWSPEKGLYGPTNKNGGVRGGTIDVVYWPGGLKRAPLGWAMPSDAQPLIIGVPAKNPFGQLIKAEEGEEPSGFSIDAFKSAVQLLNYPLPHKFKFITGPYNNLVDQVYFKDVDAAVGDITIMANRSNYVDFTQPYAESGLIMVIPVKSEEGGWLFVEPFTATMWLVVSIVFVYTTFTVWFLEHKINPEFKEAWKDQLSMAVWFTSSTLFFSHKEELKNPLTRVVMVIWLFVIFVISSTYTASLTSIVTVHRLEPTVTDIETLRRSNAHVGCYGDSFMRSYLEDVLNFHSENIISVDSDFDYPEKFKSGKIKAAFLETPNLFLAKYCKDYHVVGMTHRFGGLGFVFPRGSPLARDLSKAFLELSEDGILDKLEKQWFQSSPECNNMESVNNKNLSLNSFWTLFLITLFTSTSMLILCLVRLYSEGNLQQYYQHTVQVFLKFKEIVEVYLKCFIFHPVQPILTSTPSSSTPVSPNQVRVTQ